MLCYLSVTTAVPLPFETTKYILHLWQGNMNLNLLLLRVNRMKHETCVWDRFGMAYCMQPVNVSSSTLLFPNISFTLLVTHTGLGRIMQCKIVLIEFKVGMYSRQQLNLYITHNIRLGLYAAMQQKKFDFLTMYLPGTAGTDLSVSSR